MGAGASQSNSAGAGRPCTTPTEPSAKAVDFSRGACSFGDTPGMTIFNLATQPLPRRSARLEYIDSSLRKAIRIAESNAIPAMGMPRIGTGYGGLEWIDVRRILECAAEETGILLAVYDLSST